MAATEPTMYSNRRLMALYAAMLAYGALCALGFTALVGPWEYRFAPDSASYVEAARSFLGGEGLAISAPFDQAEPDRQPSPLWPPGFSLLIAALAWLGLDAREAALLIPQLAWILVPVASVFALRPALGLPGSVSLALLSGLAPGVIQEGFIASSDVPFLVLCMTACGLWLRALESGSRGLFMLGGLIAGIAYGWRNSGTALLVATAAAFVAAGAFRLHPWQRVRNGFMAWGAGLALPLLLLLGYNVATFDSLQPYDMPPSSVGLATNARAFLEAQLHDVFASETAASLAWNGLWLAVVVPLVTILVLVAGLRFWLASDRKQRSTLLLLTLYAGGGAAMVVLARSRFEWGESIGIRHATQYSWALLGVLAILVTSLWRGSSGKAKHMLVIAGVAGLALMLGARFVHALDIVHASSATADDSLRAQRLALSRDGRMLTLVSSLPAGAFLASNVAEVLVLETGRPVRTTGRIPDLPALHERLRKTAAMLECRRTIYALIARTPFLVRTHGKEWQAVIRAGLPRQFGVEAEGADWLLVGTAAGCRHPNIG
jgi:hypothetical protein